MLTARVLRPRCRRWAFSGDSTAPTSLEEANYRRRGRLHQGSIPSEGEPLGDDDRPAEDVGVPAEVLVVEWTTTSSPRAKGRWR
jgi:hypothetical protein